MFVCVGILAQQKKHVTRKSAANTEEHLTFLGVPMTGSKTAFINKLKARNIVLSDICNQKRFKYYGNQVIVSVNENLDNINSPVECSIYYFFKDDDVNNIKKCVNKIINNIESYYNFKKKYYHIWATYDDWGNYSVYTIYSKKNPKKKIGDICLREYYYDGEYYLTQSFYDYSNNVKYNKDNYEYFNYDIKWYDYNYPLYNTASLKYGIEQNKGDIYLIVTPKGKHPRNYILQSDDMNLFYNLVKYCQDAKLRDYFVNSFLDEAEKMTEEYSDEYHLLGGTLHSIVTGYYNSLEKKKKEERERQLAQRKKSYGFMDIMHMLAPGFFTQDDVDLWNKMPEENQKAVINGAFGVFGSMGGSTWDSLSPEQKMQIHQNDNAR